MQINGDPNFIAPHNFARKVWRKNIFDAYDQLIATNMDRYKAQVIELLKSKSIIVSARNSKYQLKMKRHFKFFKIVLGSEFYIFVDEKCGYGGGCLSFNKISGTVEEQLFMQFAECEYFIYRNDKTLSSISRKSLYN